MPPKSAAAPAVETDVEALDLDGLTDLLGFHVRLAQSAIYRDFAASLKELDLTQKLCAVLTLLKANPGVSQIALANTLGTDRATMMAIVDRLQDRHLLYRERSKSDRRRQELYLTEEGQRVLAQAMRLIAKHEARFKSRFTAGELKTFVEMLRRVHEVQD